MDVKNFKKNISFSGENIFLELTDLDAKTKKLYIVPDTNSADQICFTGRTAIALNGMQNISALIKQLKSLEALPELLLFPSHYNTGIAEFNDLAQALKNADIDFTVIEYSSVYDEPSQLVSDREEFEKVLLKYEHSNAEDVPLKQTDVFSFNRWETGSLLRNISLSDNDEKVPTGIEGLDALLGGGIEGLTVIGAAPSMGKTTFCVQLAGNIAKAGKRVLYFSLEQSPQKLALKNASRELFTRGLQLTAEEVKESIINGNAPLALEEYIENTCSRITILKNIGTGGCDSIRENVKNYIKCYKETPVVIIDYLQLLAIGEGKASDKMNNDSAIAKLSALTEEFTTPVIAISSLSRDGANKPINMSALKESGNIEYAADIIIGMQYKGMAEGINIPALQAKNPREVEIVILKNRMESAGNTLQLSYNPAYNYFYESKKIKEKNKKKNIEIF